MSEAGAAVEAIRERLKEAAGGAKPPVPAHVAVMAAEAVVRAFERTVPSGHVAVARVPMSDGTHVFPTSMSYFPPDRVLVYGLSSSGRRCTVVLPHPLLCVAVEVVPEAELADRPPANRIGFELPPTDNAE